MDFLDTKNVYFNGEEHIKAYYEGDLVWSKMEGTINIDHARTRDGAIAGVYDSGAKGFIVGEVYEDIPVPRPPGGEVYL